LISTMTLPSTIRSARNPTSMWTSSQNHRDCLLAYNLQASFSQFMRHHRFVNAFKKPRAQGCVDAVCGIDDLRSNLILGHAETDSNKRFHAKAQRGKGAKEKTKHLRDPPIRQDVGERLACERLLHLRHLFGRALGDD